jgi:hypothetical protein
MNRRLTGQCQYFYSLSGKKDDPSWASRMNNNEPSLLLPCPCGPPLAGHRTYVRLLDEYGDPKRYRPGLREGRLPNHDLFNDSLADSSGYAMLPQMGALVGDDAL